MGTASGSLRPSWERSGGRAVAWQATEDRKGQRSPRGPRIRFQKGNGILDRAKEWHGAWVVCYVPGIRKGVGSTELKRHSVYLERLILW